MSVLTIRNIDEPTKAALRLRAARHGVSMEEEARRILRSAVGREDVTKPMGDRLMALFEPVRESGAVDGFELPIPRRQAPRKPPRFE
jgi:plasmid stability protein